MGFFKNRKAQLGKFSVQIIVAVIVVAIFLGFFFVAQRILLGENREARKTLDSIAGKINILSDGEEGKILIKGIDGWYLIGYDKKDRERPDKCFLESCVCISPKPTPNSCDEKGFHRAFGDKDVEVFTETFSYSEKIGNDELHRVRTSPKCIPLSSKIIEIDSFVNDSAIFLSISNNPKIFEPQRFFECSGKEDVSIERLPFPKI